MVSVPCATVPFRRGVGHLESARSCLGRLGYELPLLAKEFVIDERQVAQARRPGADSVLLIARIVSPTLLADLVAAARAEGLEPLVEVVTEAELESAVRRPTRSSASTPATSTP